MTDPINHPKHYKRGKLECIDIIEAWSLCYHIGNAFKYIYRYDLKGDPVENIKKAIWYLNRWLTDVQFQPVINTHRTTYSITNVLKDMNLKDDDLKIAVIYIHRLVTIPAIKQQEVEVLGARDNLISFIKKETENESL